MSAINPDDPAEIHAPVGPAKDEEPQTALVASVNSSPAGFGSRDAFTLLQQQAKLMAASELVPAPYKGSIANCAIALEIAFRVGCSPLMVAQNLDIIKGRPSWRAQYVVASINSHPRFSSSLEYVYEGTPNTESWSCYAKAVRASDGKVITGPKVSMKMAKEEGWLGKEGSKWKTLPELMLAYRAATFFGRLNVPEILMGMLTTDELQDMGERIRATTKADVVNRFVEAEPVCTHDAGPVTKETPSPHADEPPYIEEVCAACNRSWAEIEKEREEKP